MLDVHADPEHHRCVVTIAGSIDDLVETVLDRVRLAVARLDLGRHRGLHPRVGVADVLPLVPLGGAALSDAVAGARKLGELIWTELRVPVFFYADAAGGRRLADIRAGRARPDLGEGSHPTAGVACVGARRLLVAYNLAFTDLDLDRARAIARSMREMPGVQALAFPMAGRVQLSMNLTRLELTGVPAVHEQASRLAGREGEPELVGLCPAGAAGPGCDGALLEARLAAAAARRAAATARARGGEELTRLGERLEAEGRSLAALTAGQEEVLGGAERAAALVRVLRRAGLADAETELTLQVAARGLRAAVTPQTEARFQRRIELLDRDPVLTP